MSIEDDLANKVRVSGVRVAERLELLRAVEDEEGAALLQKRIEELEQRIRKAAKKICEDLA
ncbi:MAG: hypothetical protein KDC14_13115 [Planctomycetes bacterium]|nr:hypothetical protein [Planctomycetota bacterium]